MTNEQPGPVDPDTPPRPAHHRVELLVLVLLGGALGTAARYGLARLWPQPTDGWPTGTFAANLAGCLVLGFLLEALARSGPDAGARQLLRLGVGTGFCGGLTTYSTFAVESELLAEHGCAGLMFGYLAATVVAGLVAVLLGVAVAARVVRRAR